MASIFDILNNTDFSSILNTIESKARGTIEDVQSATPGGLGGIFGAGALGAVLGNLMGGNAAKGVALAGLGAVAYNFYKKWAQSQESGNQEAGGWPFQGQNSSNGYDNQDSTHRAKNQFGPGFDTRPAVQMDPTAQLIARAMNYAARADGNIDEAERQRMREVLKNVLPEQNIDIFIDEISKEPIDPSKIAEMVISANQAEDIYRLSCITIDLDHFMEKSYLDALARALSLSSSRQKELETEANNAKRQLMNAISA